MSYTARPPFTGGMSNQNQQQQQGGQPNNANIGASGIPNIPMMNNAAAMPGNHLGNPSGSSPMSVIDQKIFQQQLLLQRQLLQQQFQQQQTSQQNQQAKFQQQPNQQQALTRIMSEMLNDKNGSNVAQQSQHLQQIVQLQALTNMMQMQAAQQKSFQQQQQSVPLPTNTTITPVARQNMQAMQQKPPVNYPRSNAHSKNVSPNTVSSPMQSRKSFPNAPKSAVPQMQSGMIAAPLNISGSSSKSILPQIPSALSGVTATNAPKGYADLLAASLTNSQSSMNITPSLTITKTSSPSSSASLASKNNVSLANKSISSNASSQKSFLPEAISMSLGNVPLSVKASQSPSVTVIPTNKPTNISPTNKTIPITPHKMTMPPNVPGLQKLSPTSPRTKQTPRKNTNPIRTTSLSPATQTSSQIAVPPIDTKVTNLSVSNIPLTPKPPVASQTVANASSIKPPIVNVVPPTPPKANITAPSVAASAATPPKPTQSTPASNSSAASPKPPSVTPKTETIPAPTIPNVAPQKVAKTECLKSSEVKSETSEKAIKPENTAQPVSAEKVSVSPSTKAPATVSNKQTESKTKPNASQNAPAPSNTNQNASKANESTVSSGAKPVADPGTKTPVAKVTKATPATPATPSSSTSTPAPVLNSAETRVKRNRLKTIPYQSPTPEIELVSKISANEAMNAHKKKKMAKIDEDKLTLFYKSEFLAVRNADGGFFLCQAMNNVYKSSPKIRIRWLSEDAANKHLYSLDFYDTTDIECVLTSVTLNKMAKGKLELTKAECDRIENILKKALDVEKGIVERPDVTEENPDGLDLSLYKDESQIEKKTSAKRKASDKSDSAKKSTTDAKKRKIDAESTIDTPDKSSAKVNKSAKKTPVKSTPAPTKKKDSESAKNSGESVQTTPNAKRVATKRKLVDETGDIPENEIISKQGTEASKEDEATAKVSKNEEDSPKQSSEKTAAVDSAAQSGRATRRSRN